MVAALQCNPIISSNAELVRGVAINLCGSVWRLICAATICISLVGLDLGFLCPLCAVAQNSETPLPLPHLETCQHVSHPLLPPKWRGAFLMAPFTASQLVLSEIIYDGSLPAMLVKLYGVRSGSTRLFVIGNKTYLLPQDGSDGQCEGLGDTGWTPLPRDWLAEGAQCAGSAPLSETSVQWWKISNPTGSPWPNWIWFKSADQSPFRLLFQKPGDQLSILSSYALSYQVNSRRFRKRISRRRRIVSAWQAGATVRPAPLCKTHCGYGTVALESQHRTSTVFFPSSIGLPDATRPSWPEALGMTMVLTPLDFHTNPVASRSPVQLEAAVAADAHVLAG